MKNLERRDELRQVIAVKQAEISEILATPRRDSVQRKLSHAFGLLSTADQIMGNSIERFEYPGVDEYEEHLFGGVDQFIRAASCQVAAVTSAIGKFGDDTEVL